MKRILNYKLFLENLENDDDLARNVEGLKKSMTKTFEPIFMIEEMIRIVGDRKKLEEGADFTINLLYDMFEASVNNHKTFSEEFKEILLDKFYEKLKSNRPIFIEKSFKEGIEKSIHFLIEFSEDMKKKMDQEGEEWKKPKDIDYSDMSKSEIQSEIDQALDDGDFKRVEFLAQYLKESFEISDKDIENIRVFMDRLVDILSRFYPIA